MDSTIPKPGDPNVEGIRPPIVYIRDIPKWEYKCISRSLEAEGLLGEPEMNELGSEGWELVCLLHHEQELSLYFKRVKYD